MSLELSQSVASSGLANISRQIAVISQNVSNANTQGYVREIGVQESFTADGYGLGVRSGATFRDIDAVLQGEVLTQDAAVAGLQTRQAALSAIDGVLGKPGSGTDLASLLGALRDGLTTLADDPSNQTQQSAVVNAASSLARGINALSQAYATQRQGAQDAIAADVSSLNADLADVGRLSGRIVSIKAQGGSTADLENQRDGAIQKVALLTGVRVLARSDGDVTLVTDDGLALPTSGGAGPFGTSGASLGAGSFHPGGGAPGVTLGGADVTAQITGGRIGANLTLRDATLPADQAQLDEFAQTLATRFDAQGLTLFTRPDGSVPTATGPLAQSGYVGFAAEISVNPAVAASPSQVRDGTHDVAGAWPFTVNPPGGPSGFSTLATRLLDYALGAQSSPGAAQPAPNVSGLGPSGALSAPYAAPSDLASFASSLVGAQAQDSASASDRLKQETDLQTSLTARLDSRTGVSIDTELANLTTLQNAYGANAKVLSAVQALWTALLGAVAP